VSTVGCFYALLIGLLVATSNPRIVSGVCIGFLCPLDRAARSDRDRRDVVLALGERFLCPLDRAARSDRRVTDIAARVTNHGFYALLIGLLVATRVLEGFSRQLGRPGFYALLIGLLVATDPATDGP